MNNKIQSTLASGLLVIAGAWVLSIPIFASVSDGVMISSFVTGAVIALAGLVQLFWENVFPSWIEAAAAAWLLIAAAGFEVTNAVGWNLVLAAVFTFILAIWDGIEVSQLNRSHHRN